MEKLKKNKRLFALLMTFILITTTVGEIAASYSESTPEEKQTFEVVIKDNDGEITLDRENGLYKSGETVKIHAEDKSGNQVEQIEVMNVETKGLILFSKETDMEFIMPDSNVVVEAMYKKEEIKIKEDLEQKEYEKTFKVKGAGTLRISDAEGNIIRELTDGQEEILKYHSDSDAPAEVQIQAIADAGYCVSSYETKWPMNGNDFSIPENEYHINKTMYERGHYLESATWNEIFEVTFQAEGTQIMDDNFARTVRSTGDIDNPQVGDVYTGSAYVVYDGYPNKTYNGTGYIVPTTGDFIDDNIIMSTCASGPNFWAPQTGQTGTYTITIQSIDTTTGRVVCFVYWTNDKNYAYQDLSGTYEYYHDFDGGLSVYKEMADSLSAIIYPYGFAESLDLRATFGIYSDTKAKNKVAEIKTNKDGTPIKDEISLQAGTYYIKELVSPKGFALNETIKKIEIGAGASKRVVIKDKYFRAKINGVKKDALTGKSEPTKGLSLAGAEYSVYGDAACKKYITKGITDEKGKMEFESMYFGYGVYYIKETVSPPGYELDPTIYKIVVDESLGLRDGSTYRFNDLEFISMDDVETGIGKVIKISSNPDITDNNNCYALVDTVFKLTSLATGEEVETRLVTNKKGESQELELPIGDYILEEVEAPLGFEKSAEQIPIKIKKDETTVVTFSNVPLSDPVDILLQKRDSDTGETVPTGNGTFEGAEYTFSYYDGYYSNEAELEGKKPIRTWVLATDANGIILFDEAKKISGNDFYYNSAGYRTLPLGTITIKESKASNEGYQLDPTLYIRNIKVKEDGGNSGEIIQSYQIPVSPEPPIRGGMRIEKWDNETNNKNAQGSASLKNTEIQIINRSKNKVQVEGKLYEPGEVVKTVYTDDEGVYESAPDLLSYGDYEALEVSPPEGYRPEGKLQELFEIREEGKIEDLTKDRAIKNDPIRGGFQIEKWDNEINQNVAQGGATFQDTVIQIFNRSEKAVKVEGALYEPGQVVKTFATDENGVYCSANDLLPYGEYEAIEVSSPKGYLPTGKLQESFEIRENGEIVPLTEDRAIKDDPIRGDLKGVKISDRDMKRLADIPFQITSLTTGESHIIVTDENGMFDTSSSWNPHSQNTNRGETSEDGIWFGQLDVLDDEVGALLYDKYSIQELPCEANMDRELIPAFAISVSRNMVTVDLGTLTNLYTPVIEIETTAIDTETEARDAYVNDKSTIVDTVSYINLVKGMEYTIKGILMDKETGEALLVNGKEVIAEKTFTAKKADGTVELTFTFDALALIGKEVVVFERLYYEGNEVATHTDIEDKGQTIKYKAPNLTTTATDQETGEHTGFAGEKVKVVDIVKYTNLIVGKEYTIKGILMDKETNQALRINEKEITAEKIFTAEIDSGSVEMEFTFDASALKGKEVVVFEQLFYNGREIVAHADIEDMGQTVTYETPEVETTATDQETGEHQGFTNKESTILDVVKYKNLILGKMYTVKGILMDKETGKALLIHDKEITVEKTFIAEAANGSVTLSFTFDSSTLKGKEVVVFERLYYEEREIAVHTDIEDDNQTVTYKEPELKTTATDNETKGHSGYVSEKTTLLDVVEYKNLIPAKEYTIKGVLMDKESGKALLVKGMEIRAEKTFTAESATGSIELRYTFDSSGLKGKRVVVFESLYYETQEIAIHTDLEDKNQTVKFRNPDIQTTASEKNTGNKELNTSKKVTIIDAIKYTNLISGKIYQIKGILMDKATAKPLLVNGKQVTVEKTFKAEKENGIVEVEFALNASSLADKDVVVYEKLFFAEREVVAHEDINDKGQTVKFIKPKTPDKPEEPKTPDKPNTPSTPPKTGDETQIAIYVIMVSIAGIFLGNAIYKRNRKKEK